MFRAVSERKCVFKYKQAWLSSTTSRKTNKNILKLWHSVWWIQFVEIVNALVIFCYWKYINFRVLLPFFDFLYFGVLSSMKICFEEPCKTAKQQFLLLYTLISVCKYRFILMYISVYHACMWVYRVIKSKNVCKYQENHLEFIKWKKICYTCNFNLTLCCTIFVCTIYSVRSLIFLVDG